MTNRIIPFSRFGAVGLIFSLIVTFSLVGITIYRGGFNLGIDFQSGQSVDVQLDESVEVATLQQSLSSVFDKVLVTKVGNEQGNRYNIKLPSTIENQEKDLTLLQETLAKSYGVEIQSTAFIGAGVSQQLFRSVLTLTIGALTLILLYIWLRFKLHFAVSALFALIHDTLFIIGVVGAFQIEVSISTVAAILTIIGYSLNDTIVIFDRVRENIVLIREGSLKKIVNISITQTLSRTIITSLTTLLAVVALMIFATGEVFNFARTLAIGVLEGTWSSIFIATPLLYLFSAKKILASYRKKQGSGAVYSTEETSTSTQQTPVQASASSISQKDISKIKADVLSSQKKRKRFK